MAFLPSGHGCDPVGTVSETPAIQSVFGNTAAFFNRMRIRPLPRRRRATPIVALGAWSA